MKTKGTEVLNSFIHKEEIVKEEMLNEKMNFLKFKNSKLFYNSDIHIKELMKEYRRKRKSSRLKKRIKSRSKRIRYYKEHNMYYKK